MVVCVSLDLVVISDQGSALERVHLAAASMQIDVKCILSVCCVATSATATGYILLRHTLSVHFTPHHTTSTEKAIRALTVNTHRDTSTANSVCAGKTPLSRANEHTCHHGY